MGVTRGARPPSHTAYFVALGGVLLLLLLLLAYCLCFCLKRVKELATQPLPEPVKSVRPPPPVTTAYPVQPEVRESATAMARLCTQIHPTLSPSKPTMLPTPPRSPARCTSPCTSPRAPRARSPVYGYTTRTCASPRSPLQASPRSPIQASPRSPIQASPRSPIQASPRSPIQASPRSPINASRRVAYTSGAYAVSETGRVLARSPGSKGRPLQPPKIIAQAKRRPNSMPEQPTPAISVSEVK